MLNFSGVDYSKEQYESLKASYAKNNQLLKEQCASLERDAKQIVENSKQAANEFYNLSQQLKSITGDTFSSSKKEVAATAKKTSKLLKFFKNIP